MCCVTEACPSILALPTSFENAHLENDIAEGGGGGLFEKKKKRRKSVSLGIGCSVLWLSFKLLVSEFLNERNLKKNMRSRGKIMNMIMHAKWLHDTQNHARYKIMPVGSPTSDSDVKVNDN